MGIKSVLLKYLRSRPVRPVAPEARPRATGIQPAKPLPPDPYPKPFLVDSVSLWRILYHVRKIGEIDRKYVFDIKKGILVLDGEEERIHLHIANAIWSGGYRAADISGGSLKFEYAEGVFTVRIYDFSTSFHRMHEDLIKDRRTIKAHIQNLLAGINCEFTDIDENFNRGLVFTIKIS